jgi:hypothetical protein
MTRMSNPSFHQWFWFCTGGYIKSSHAEHKAHVHYPLLKILFHTLPDFSVESHVGTNFPPLIGAKEEYHQTRSTLNKVRSNTNKYMLNIKIFAKYKRYLHILMHT